MRDLRYCNTVFRIRQCTGYASVRPGKGRDYGDGVGPTLPVLISCRPRADLRNRHAVGMVPLSIMYSVPVICAPAPLFLPRSDRRHVRIARNGLFAAEIAP